MNRRGSNNKVIYNDVHSEKAGIFRLTRHKIRHISLQEDFTPFQEKPLK